MEAPRKHNDLVQVRAVLQCLSEIVDIVQYRRLLRRILEQPPLHQASDLLRRRAEYTGQPLAVSAASASGLELSAMSHHV